MVSPILYGQPDNEQEKELSNQTSFTRPKPTVRVKSKISKATPTCVRGTLQLGFCPLKYGLEPTDWVIAGRHCHCSVLLYQHLLEAALKLF